MIALTHCRTAPHRHFLDPTTDIVLHPLHLHHPLRAWYDRRQGLLPSLPRHTVQHTCTHCGEALRYTLSPDVDSRCSIPSFQRSAISRPRTISATFQSTGKRCARATRHWCYAAVHRRGTRRVDLSEPATRAGYEWPPQWRCQFDRRAQPVRSRVGPFTQRPRGRTAEAAEIELQLSAPEH